MIAKPKYIRSVLTVMLAIILSVSGIPCFASGTENITLNTAYGTAPNVYNYTGSAQTYAVPGGTSFVKVRAWGSQGGTITGYGGASGGLGAYTEAIVDVRSLTNLYVYVGGNETPFNGGGAAGVGAQGGGATDVRTTNGQWNDPTSLASRILVAAGGGGTNANQIHNHGDSYYLHSQSGAKDLLEGLDSGTYQIGVGQAGYCYKPAMYQNDSQHYGGSGGGYYGGTNGNSGESWAGHARAYKGIIANWINSGLGRVEVTPLVGDYSSVIADTYKIDCSTLPASSLKFQTSGGAVTVTNNSTAGRQLWIGAPNSTVNILDNAAQITLRLNASSANISNTSIFWQRSSTAVMNLSAILATFDGPNTGAVDVGTANLTDCTLAAGKLWQLNSSGDVSVSNTPLVGGVFNGMTNSNISIGVSQTDSGLNQISLTGFNSWFMQSPSTTQNGGTLPMHFVLERKLQGASIWERQEKVIVNLTASAVIRDLATLIKQDITYRIGYKRSDRTGYVIVLDNSFVGNSPGSMNLDEAAPTISYFQVAGDSSEVKTNRAIVELVATDNRTVQNKLKMRVDVNDQDFVPSSGSFKAATLDQKGDYSAVTTELPLQEGNNRITAEVYDEAGNKTIQIKYVKYIPDGSLLAPQISPDIVAPGATSAITLTNTMNTALKSTIVDGVNVWVADSNIITGAFKAEDLPADLVSFNYAISGDQYSKQLSIAKPFKMQLPPVAGMYLVKLSFTNSAGNSSQEPVTMNILYDKTAPTIGVKSTTGATVTKSNSTAYLLDIADDASKTFTWSIDGNTWSAVPDDFVIAVPLTSGYNNKPLYVKDSAGRVGSAWIKIFKMN